MHVCESAFRRRNLFLLQANEADKISKQIK